MDIEVFESLSETQMAEWRAFLADAVHQHPRQDPRFAEVERATGNDVLFAIGRKNGQVAAIALFTLEPSRFIPRHYAAASSLSGPVCDDGSDMIAFLNAVSKDKRFRRVDALRVTPYWLGEEGSALSARLSAEGFKVTDPKPQRDTGLIDLSKSEDELLASFGKSARRKVRLVEKSDIVIRRIDTEEASAEFFERLNTLVIARHNLTPVTRGEQEAGFHHIYNDPSIGAIFAAYHESVFLGGLLLYRSGLTAHARRYVADPAAAQAVNNLRVAPALWLEGLVWAKAQGCRWFDVEGYFPVENKDHPSFNVYEYKREFKPEHVSRTPEHTLVLNPSAHTLNSAPRRIKDAIKRRFPLARKLSPKRLFTSRKG